MENTPEITVGETKRPTPALLAHLLSLANDFRRAFDAEELDAIPPSEPKDAYDCIIANALNFNCTICPEKDGHEPLPNGSAYFKDRRHAEHFCALTEQDPDKIIEPTLPDVAGALWVAPLTPELSAIALAFDKGELPELERDYS